ncbi:hypothetical protein CIB48_g6542 [Xylaria polymorpha]|nr:hypothetical protein CIB48_g6542 [Xylaria polymorpha]
MAFIRLYKDSDFDACADICVATLPPNPRRLPPQLPRPRPTSGHTHTRSSAHLPATCSTTGAGNAVGYCIGCPDVHVFAAAYPRYIANVLSSAVAEPDFGVRAQWVITSPGTDAEEGQQSDVVNEIVNPLALAQNAYRADWMLLEGKEAVTTRWRATMHIDLLPAWQGRGWGRQLIDRFVASVQASGQDYGEGEHIGVAGENSKVVPFYERVGFRVIEGGEREGNIWMVREIEKV